MSAKEKEGKKDRRERGREGGKKKGKEGGRELRILVIMRFNKKAELEMNSDKKHFPNVYKSSEWPGIYMMDSLWFICSFYHSR